jgi:glycosyltransferase involved in cell wall biosynthesis
MTRSGLRIGLDVAWDAATAPGLARYAKELLASLRRVAPGHTYLPVERTRRGLARLAWAQFAWPAELRVSRADVCHATSHHAPLAWGGPRVVTLHDLSALRLPRAHPRGRVAVTASLLPLVAHRADALIVPSRATADDLLRLVEVDPARVHVIPEAPSPAFRRVTDPARLGDVARRHRLRPGYLLTVGTLEPRKNLPALLAAWSRLRAEGWDGQLVVCGRRGWRDRRIVRALDRASACGEVRVLGRVPDGELAAILSLAGVFAFPSLLEGFGLPVAEALRCGIPTVTSDRGALAEHAAGAALLVDPTDHVAFADAIALALADGPVRRRLLAAGPRHAAAWTWDDAARATERVYRLVAEARA